jgi:hypothetical protein
VVSEIGSFRRTRAAALNPVVDFIDAGFDGSLSAREKGLANDGAPVSRKDNPNPSGRLELANLVLD